MEVKRPWWMPLTNIEFWCAQYKSETIAAFRDAHSGTTRRPADIVYFATTYPLPGIELDKRFVVELR